MRQHHLLALAALAGGLTLTAAGCNAWFGEERYTYPAELSDMEPVAYELFDSSVRIVVPFQGGCCETEGWLEVEEIEGGISIRPFYSDIACRLRCLATYEDTVVRQIPQPDGLRVQIWSGSEPAVAIDTVIGAAPQ